MPDISRSDSQRSDASHKPRVSFNRDVHVKRIGREGVVEALAGDGEGHLVPLAVRRERPLRLSRRQLEREAEEVLRQAERVNCTPGSSPHQDKYNTLPPRPRPRHSSGHQPVSSIFNSLDRNKSKKKKPVEGRESVRLERRFSSPDTSWDRDRDRQQLPPPPPPHPAKHKLNRSVSDAGRKDDKKDKERNSIFGTLDRIRKKKKPPSLSESALREEILPPLRKKKQLSPIIEMSPKVEAGEPWLGPPTAADAGASVVYAEVVARPGGKATVHTAVPVRSSPGSEEDEGVDMGVRSALGRRSSYDSDVLRPTSTSPRRDDDIHEDRIINMLRSKSNPLLDEGFVGGYRREVRTERVVRVGGGDDVDGRGRADGMDYSIRRRGSKDFLEDSPLKSNYFSEEVGKVHSYDDLDRVKLQSPVRAWTPPLETSLIDSNNLSYRRERLESRLTNHKRRFFGKGYRDENPKSDDLRKDFLTSQLKGEEERGYFEKKIATEMDTHHRQQMLKNKDVFADSGVEMSDYRKESSKDVAALNKKNAETMRIIRTETTRTKSIPVLNVTTDSQSDGERRYKGDISSRFIEEERRKRDVVPTSTTLVKNFSKPPKEAQKLAKSEKVSKEKKKEKLTRMDKVKQLMFGSKEVKKTKKKTNEDEEEDLLRSRYTEYKGSDVSVHSSPVAHRRHQSSSEVDDRTDQEQEQEYYGSRQRLATPTPSHSEHSWLKSLTRRNKLGKNEKKHKVVNSHGDRSQSSKQLRFFGDSDRESIKSHLRPQDSSPHHLQVPPQQSARRHLLVDSSAESTTGGEDSNHSQKSVVYLHAATVGDIPGSGRLRRSLSREELSSTPTPVAQSRTLSRSVSVLAPWRPKRDRREINYDNNRPPRPPRAKSKSRENLTNHQESRRGSRDSVLSDKRQSHSNLKFVGKKESYDEVDKRTSTLGRSHHSVTDKRDLSRSVSIPKDSRVSSGWFRGKKSK